MEAEQEHIPVEPGLKESSESSPESLVSPEEAAEFEKELQELERSAKKEVADFKKSTGDTAARLEEQGAEIAPAETEEGKSMLSALAERASGFFASMVERFRGKKEEAPRTDRRPNIDELISPREPASERLAERAKAVERLNMDLAKQARNVLKHRDRLLEDLQDPSLMPEHIQGFEEELRNFEIAAERVENRIEYVFAAEETLEFVDKDPVELQAELRGGASHPRWKEALAGYRDITKNVDLSRTDLMRLYMPPNHFRAYGQLDRRLRLSVPDAKQSVVDAALSQMENGFYEEAAVSVDQIISEPGLQAEIVVDLRAVAETMREAAKEKHEQYEKIGQLQEQLYGTLLDRLPQKGMGTPAEEARREFLERRQLVERVLKQGTLVGELKPMAETMTMPDGQEVEINGGAFKPMKGTFEFEGVKVEAVVKLAQVERQVRKGLVPGRGPLRAVAGAMSNIGMGADSMPSMTAREQLTDADGNSYGEALLVELVKDTYSCARPDRDGWFENRSEEFKRSMRMSAINDDIRFRTDGEDRNYLADGTLMIIDTDLDSPTDPSELQRSMLLEMMSEHAIGEDERAHVRAYKKPGEPKTPGGPPEPSPMDLYLQAMDLTQYNMQPFIEYHRARVDAYERATAFPKYEGANTIWNEKLQASLDKEKKEGAQAA